MLCYENSASQLRSAPFLERSGAERAPDLPERSGIFTPETAPLRSAPLPERNDRSGVMYLAWDSFATPAPAPESLGAEGSALRGSRSGAGFSLRSALRSAPERGAAKHYMRIMLNAYVLSIYDYCIEVWCVHSIAELNILQSKVYRFLFSYINPTLSIKYKKSPRSMALHSSQNMHFLLLLFNLLSIHDRMIWTILKNAFRYRHSIIQLWSQCLNFLLIRDRLGQCPLWKLNVIHLKPSKGQPTTAPLVLGMTFQKILTLKPLKVIAWTIFKSSKTIFPITLSNVVP